LGYPVAGIIDCSGDCVDADDAEYYVGDGYCDDVSELYGFHLDCAEFSFDGDDCL
jgi:hypothetical protein